MIKRNAQYCQKTARNGIGGRNAKNQTSILKDLKAFSLKLVHRHNAGLFNGFSILIRIPLNTYCNYRISNNPSEHHHLQHLGFFELVRP